MKFICTRCGNHQLSVSTFVDYGSSVSNNSWHWLFRCPRCGYSGEDAELETEHQDNSCKQQDKYE